MGLIVVIAFGLIVTSVFKNHEEHCKTNDCRSTEQRIIDEKDNGKAKGMCLKEFGTSSPDNIPTRCKILLGV